MKIYNTVPYFLENYVPSVEFLKHYHEKFSQHFEEYFLYHCKNPNEKITNAIEKYPSVMEDIKKSSVKIEHLIHQVTLAYKEKYGVQFTKDVHIIVGAYGSNAFTHRQIIPEITFCLEKLSSNDTHLLVIIAHEFGHALHNILTDQKGMDWAKVQWFHPFTLLLQEGCATYFSKQIVQADKSVYFSYDDEGGDWLHFAEKEKSKIINSFLKDIKERSPVEIFHEWFSINGGSHFGNTRLGYFIGYCVVGRLIEKYDEQRAVTVWGESNFHDVIETVLLELI